jgi:hypothetical protein
MILALASIVVLVMLVDKFIFPVDYRVREMEALKEEYVEIRGQAVQKLVLGQQTAATVLIDRNREDAAYRKLKEYAGTVPWAIVPNDIKELIQPPTQQ